MCSHYTQTSLHCSICRYAFNKKVQYYQLFLHYCSYAQHVERKLTATLFKWRLWLVLSAHGCIVWTYMQSELNTISLNTLLQYCTACYSTWACMQWKFIAVMYRYIRCHSKKIISPCICIYIVHQGLMCMYIATVLSMWRGDLQTKALDGEWMYQAEYASMQSDFNTISSYCNTAQHV